MENQEMQKFEGWATVNLFGHSVERGYITTLYFGNQAMFRIDCPAIPEREVTLLDGGAFNGKWLYRGSRVIKAAIPAKVRTVGIAAVYSIDESTEQIVLGEVGGEGPILSVIREAECNEEIPF